jgi:hypothetical protein
MNMNEAKRILIKEAKTTNLFKGLKGLEFLDEQGLIEWTNCWRYFEMDIRNNGKISMLIHSDYTWSYTNDALKKALEKFYETLLQELS